MGSVSDEDCNFSRLFRRGRWWREDRPSFSAGPWTAGSLPLNTDALEILSPQTHVRTLGSTVKIPRLNRYLHHGIFLGLTFGMNSTFSSALEIGVITQLRVTIRISGTAIPQYRLYDLYETFMSRQNPITQASFSAWVYSHRLFDQRSVPAC